MSDRFGYDKETIEDNYYDEKCLLIKEYSSYIIPEEQINYTPVPVRTKDCVACMVTFPEVEILISPCGHGFCGECFPKFVETALEGQSPVPPRCCDRTTFTIFVNQPYIKSSTRKEFAKTLVDLQAVERTYCSNIACQAPILPWFVKGDVGHCHFCEERTCARCKKSAHRGRCTKVKGLEKVEDKELKKVLALAIGEGWKRCPRCRRPNELTWGCSHMTCSCGHVFCFFCEQDYTHKVCPKAAYFNFDYPLEMALFRGLRVLDRIWESTLTIVDRLRFNANRKYMKLM